MMTDVSTEVVNIAAEISGKKPYSIFDDTRFIGDLGLDSLDCIIVLHKCEKAFKIKISLKEANSCETIGDLCSLIRTKIG